LNSFRKEKINKKLDYQKTGSIKLKKLKMDSIINSGLHLIDLSIFDASFLSMDDQGSYSGNSYLEIYDKDNIIIHHSHGSFANYGINNNTVTNLNSNFCEILKNTTKIECNQTELYGIRDIYLDNNRKFYISTFANFPNNKNIRCEGLLVFISSSLKQNIDKKYIQFEEFYKTPSCVEDSNAASSGGRIQSFDNSKEILLTVGDFQHSHTDVGKVNELEFKSNHISQNKKLHFGKIILINENKKAEVYSMGHRNPQGLFIHNNLVLATEHGPNGGDEINLIVKEKNYGYPLVSMGFPYNYDYNMDKNNSEIYTNPLIYFTPSIGISEIIIYKGNEFYRWNNKTLVTSLVENSMYLIDIDFSKQPPLPQSIEKIDFGNIVIANNTFLTTKNVKTLLTLGNSKVNFRIRDIKITEEGKIFFITDDNFIAVLERSSEDYIGDQIK